VKLLSLVVRNLGRRRLRTVLSVFTCFIAGFLLTALISVPASINRITHEAGDNLRLIVSAPNAYMLPIWYRDVIRKMPGVMAATAQIEWGAIYRDPRQPIVAYGVDPDVVKVFPEGHLTQEEIEQLNRDRRAVEVGSVLMKNNHWRLGESVTLQNPDGKVSLTFVPVAILSAKRDQNAFVFRRELLDEAIKNAYALDLSDRATFIVVRVDSVADMPRVAEEIDHRFHNSEYETSTIPQSDALASGLSALADLSTIVFSLCAVVMVTLLLIAGNAMAMNVRERISEVAVIRALGFQRGQVAAILFGEATVMAILGGVAGAAAAFALWGNGVTLGSVLGGQGYMQVTPDAALAGALAIVGVCIASAIVPVIQAVAISPALAFRKVV
jgi:putative ABC transport system permease protein